VLGTGFGIGFFPAIPGTIMTLVVAILWWFMPDYIFQNISEFPATIHYDRYLMMLGALIIFSFIAIQISTVCERKFGKDANAIVIDEVVGFLFAVLFLPITKMMVIYAFILFRILDISKPLFIDKLQNLPRGYGVVLDDIGAGVVTCAILKLIFFIRPEFFYLLEKPIKI
jgi:phosphatidylglycerophosphatase A